MTGDNQTGPLGNSPGRGLGPCGGGRRRQGFGGRRSRVSAGVTMMDPAPAADERGRLAQEAVSLEHALADVRRRLDTLNKDE